MPAIKPEISFGQILQVLALLFGGFLFFLGYETRITTLENNVASNTKAITRILEMQTADSDKINDLRIQMQGVGSDIQSIQRDSANMSRQLNKLVEKLLEGRNS